MSEKIQENYIVLMLPSHTARGAVQTACPFIELVNDQAMVPADVKEELQRYLEENGFIDEQDYQFMEADMQNGYGDERDHDDLSGYEGTYFPSGHTSTAVNAKDMGPSAAKHGNNPMHEDEIFQSIKKRLSENLKKKLNETASVSLYKVFNIIETNVAAGYPDTDGWDMSYRELSQLYPGISEDKAAELFNRAIKAHSDYEDFGQLVSDFHEQYRLDNPEIEEEVVDLVEIEDEEEGFEPFNDGAIVLFKKSSPYYHPGIFQVSYNAIGAKDSKPWVGDLANDRGWYVYASELENFDPEEHAKLLRRASPEELSAIAEYYGAEVTDSMESLGLGKYDENGNFEVYGLDGDDDEDQEDALRY